MNSIMELVKAFVQLSKDIRPEFIEKWLSGEVNDYDMDMILIEEIKHRSKTYKRLFNDSQLHSRDTVKE